MSKLCVPLSLIAQGNVALDIVVAATELHGNEEHGFSVQNVAIAGTLSQVDSEYLFQGTLSFAYEHPCDRCLEDVVVPTELDVTCLFEHGPGTELELGSEAYEVSSTSDDGGLAHYFEGNEINLAPAVWEEITLAAPGKFLCREDCAGLCPRCGGSLNGGPCGCPDENDEKEERQGGLATLAMLFPKLGTKSSEED